MLDIDGSSLHAAVWGSGVPEIVMLHDGLGSIAQWRDLPELIAQRSGRTVLAYERAGHGSSTPVPTGPWPTDWLHREAAVLGEVLQTVGCERPALVGHSDGGSTALIYGAQTAIEIGAVITLAPHSWVEDLCFAAIERMRANTDGIVRSLGSFHAEPAALFEAWSGVWVSDEFQPWDIRPHLASLNAPTLVAQGANDGYASDAHAHLTAEAVGDNARAVIVPDVGHIMHHDAPLAIAQLVVDFLGDADG